MDEIYSNNLCKYVLSRYRIRHLVDRINEGDETQMGFSVLLANSVLQLINS